MLSVSNRCLVDGVEADRLDVFDRGLAYGDGVFETLRVVDGRAEFFHAHWQRFERGCRVLGMPIPKASDFRQDIARLCSDGGISCVKWIYTRGSGLRGYRVGQQQRCRRLVFRSALDRSFYEQRERTGVKVRFGHIAFEPTTAVGRNQTFE